MTVLSVSNWSFSKLLKWERCPLSVRLQYIDRLPQKEQPPENPLVRGNRIHNRMELAIKGQGPMDTEARSAQKFYPMVEHLNRLYEAGMATAEEDWLFDANWDPCTKDNYWLWVKLDYSVIDEQNGVVITGDWKTGKSGYKAVEHVQQLQLYAAVSALRFDWADLHITEVAYLDEGHLKTFEYSRDQALALVNRFQVRVDKMLNDRLFKANPNNETCRYCPYGPRNGTGACPVGV